jgi:uncharacterized protein (TIGR03086 family)
MRSYALDMADVPETYAAAAHRVDRLVNDVPDDRWAAPTPCSEWDVRALVNHLTNESLWVPETLAGKTMAEVGDRFDGDLLGDDPKGAWAAASAPAVAMVLSPGAMEIICDLSMGPTPGEEYTRQLTVDLIVHGWDLARGAGLDEHIDPDLVSAALSYIEPWKPMLASMPDYFATPIEPAPDADPQTVLLNTLGRRP